MLKELKARKAKFGFAVDRVSIKDFLPLGKLMEGLYNSWTEEDYIVEMAGMNRTDFRLYTDNSQLAEWVRQNFLIANTTP